MKTAIADTLSGLAAAGNLRSLESRGRAGNVDMSSNDYLGLGARVDLVEEFFDTVRPSAHLMTASASRLLMVSADAHAAFEATLSHAYGRAALLFNSGYHANTGIIGAFAGTNAYILADKLVHASIIDGIRLSGLPFARFRHNDYCHLERLAAKAAEQGSKLIIIAESVYSMDGDMADVEALAAVKRRYPGSMLYIDEAHAVGVAGAHGLGLAYSSAAYADVDIIIGTLGKALASTGAYAIVEGDVRDYLVNRARSLIFSTALPPINALWSKFIFERAMTMDAERRHLADLGRQLAAVLGSGHAGHIQPLVVGNPRRAVALSQSLADEGFNVLPIRTPTVPPGTDRLRFSLSAALTVTDIERLDETLKRLNCCI